MPSSITKIVSTKVVSSVKRGTKTFKIGIVTETDVWKRYHLHEDVKNMFVDVAQRYGGKFPKGTDGMYMQEIPHANKKDNRTHFTVVFLDNKRNVLDRQHFDV